MVSIRSMYHPARRENSEEENSHMRLDHVHLSSYYLPSTKTTCHLYTLAATSPSKKESTLTSAIETLSEGGDHALLNSFARAHALVLRSDARLDEAPPDVDGAVADAILACQISPTERRAWRVLASAHEAGGNLRDAMEAIQESARVDPSFSTKAKLERSRLAGLL